MEEQLAPVLDHLDRVDPGEIVGAYLYGSAQSGGLRPDSDLDLLVLTRRSLTRDEREALTQVLLDASSGSAHSRTLSDGTAGRPLELTCVVIGANRRWPDPAEHDFQFGEWMRADIQGGHTLEPTIDPDVPILLTTAQTAHRVLRGRPLAEVVDRVPPGELREAMLASIPDILGEIVGDERNTLLAFARIVTTLRTGEIVPKDVAAASAATTLAPRDRMLLERARAGYLGEVDDDWTGFADEVTALSHALAAQAHELAAPGVMPNAPIDHDAALSMWSEYRAAHPAIATDAETPSVERFGDHPELTDGLLALVLDGTKRATATLVAEFAAERQPLPRIGSHWIACDSTGAPRVILRSTELRVGPFTSVDAAFAHDEGEDDRSLDSWRENHARYWQRTAATIGIDWTEQHEVVFERFSVVWPPEAV